MMRFPSIWWDRSRTTNDPFNQRKFGKFGGISYFRPSNGYMIPSLYKTLFHVLETCLWLGAKLKIMLDNWYFHYCYLQIHEFQFVNSNKGVASQPVGSGPQILDIGWNLGNDNLWLNKTIRICYFYFNEFLELCRYTMNNEVSMFTIRTWMIKNRTLGGFLVPMCSQRIMMGGSHTFQLEFVPATVRIHSIQTCLFALVSSTVVRWDTKYSVACAEVDWFLEKVTTNLIFETPNFRFASQPAVSALWLFEYWKSEETDFVKPGVSQLG